MDTTPFTIQYLQNGRLVTAEVRPCCNENNIVDYAIWVADKLVFTIARSMEDDRHWTVALKNADLDIDNAVIQNIGSMIERNANEKSNKDAGSQG